MSKLSPRSALKRNAEKCREMVRLYPFLKVESSAKRKARR